MTRRLFAAVVCLPLFTGCAMSQSVPPATSPKLLARADGELAAERYERALKLYDQFLDTYSDDPGAPRARTMRNLLSRFLAAQATAGQLGQTLATREQELAERQAEVERLRTERDRLRADLERSRTVDSGEVERLRQTLAMQEQALTERQRELERLRTERERLRVDLERLRHIDLNEPRR